MESNYIRMKQKGFSLIELLVVVAIIGILAAVGVVAYNGYTKAAKINATKANFASVTKYIESEIMKCLAGGQLESYEKYKQNPSKYKALRDFYCGSSSDDFEHLSAMVIHYIEDFGHELGFSNPWDPNDLIKSGIRRSTDCPLVVGRITCNFAGANFPNNPGVGRVKCCCKWGEGSDDTTKKEIYDPF